MNKETTPMEKTNEEQVCVGCFCCQGHYDEVIKNQEARIKELESELEMRKTTAKFSVPHGIVEQKLSRQAEAFKKAWCIIEQLTEGYYATIQADQWLKDNKELLGEGLK